MGKTPFLDVRHIVPRERHPKIFEAFDGLKAGEAFELVNDHDPKPLFYQLMHERPGQFKWEYREEGPDVWRVSILKTSGGSKEEGPAPTPAGKPGWVAALKPTEEILIDVRPMIERGEEPFQTILKAAKGLGGGQYLRLVNSFEPVPLYAVLEKQGFEHYSELRDGTWNICFKKVSGNAPVPGGPRSAAPPGDLFDRMAARTPRLELDVRGLEPPEPMIKIIEALPSVPLTGLLFVHHHREPVLLYDKLRERGYEAVTRKLGESDYKVLIWKKEG